VGTLWIRWPGWQCFVLVLMRTEEVQYYLNITIRIRVPGEQYIVLVLMRTEEEQENLNISL
jgi:hypothetical protein